MTSGVPPGVPTESGALAAFRTWEKHRQVARWYAEALSFLVLGWLVGAAMRDEYRFSLGATAALTAWMCGGWAILLSVLHLFLVTRALDITDVVFRFLGCGLALVILLMFDRRRRERGTRRFPSRRFLLRFGLVATGVYVFYTGLIPLRFEFTMERLVRSTISAGFLPFSSYSTARLDVAVADLFEKVLAWSLLAALLAVVRHTRSHDAREIHVGRLSIVGRCVCFSVLIETAQLFSPVRTASLTDPILAGVAAVAGVALVRSGRRFLLLASERDASALTRGSTPADQQSSGSPMDKLMATLQDERDDAPLERVTDPERRTHR